ncbi:diguanylate cyclase DgcJ [Klebsiella oxytoca]|uniref:diguanylate cyclase DgcJ n=1 Tax=Klebsiella oxytoca TaxID=571 RepID=UPI000F713AF0|nr:diguanylate cyclase DgcJ [Klebsiella oxytoca]VDY51929.1 two-component response regulator and GGDEF family protein YeaJ [Klebsiella oxytoca]
MKLKNKLLRHLISAGVVVLTSSFLVYELVVSHRDMSEYMHYIVEKGEYAFLYDKYQNQLVISQIARKLDTLPSAEVAQQACDSVQTKGSVSGLNITEYTFPLLSGTLSANQSSCLAWVNDLPALQAFDTIIDHNRTHHGQETGPYKSDNKLRYFIDFKNKYVYFHTQVEIKNRALDNWNFLHDGKLGITQTNLNSLLRGRTLMSSIYVDAVTGQNILSFLSPVYHHEGLKGVVMVDVSRKDIEELLYTADRPLVWRYLDITLTDSDSTSEIIVHRSKTHLFSYAHYQHAVATNLQISLSLDVMYFLLSSWKLFLFYLISTGVLLHLVRMHFRLYIDVFKENISDSLTGLYNRKILSSLLESRMQKLTEQGVNIVFMALDCDRLKFINDTFGHNEGDRAIVMLAQSISAAIRKSDYGIRLGGDEFFLILIDYAEEEAKNITERIRQHLRTIDVNKRVNFSWGACSMAPGDSLADTMQIADARLYENKKQKKARPSGRED